MISVNVYGDSKMAEEGLFVLQEESEPIKIIKWKVRVGNTVSMGRIVLLYEISQTEKPIQRKLKAGQAGIIHKILAEEGRIVQPREPLYEMKACSHPTIMIDMCAECGADLRKEDIPKSIASVPMIHAIPELKVSEEQAIKIGQADNDRLIKDRKLVLLVDLDQTLIHSTNKNIPPNIKNVYHYQLYGTKSPWFHTRLRPGTHKFLNSVSEFYELHICTFGVRQYAHMIARFLDLDQKFFGNRILSRDECFDPRSKKANLKALFPCGDDMVCIIDDREDVWSHASNLIHVKPYHFFQHTGDINAPPGLDKRENDNKVWVDLSQIPQKAAKVESSNGEGTGDSKETEGDSKEDKIQNRETKDATESTAEATLNETSEEKSSNNSRDGSDENSPSNSSEEGNKDEEQKIDDIAKETEDSEKTAEPIDLKEIKPDDDGFIEIEDSDDYLLYLEDILKNIHKTYYEQYDKDPAKIPDLKKVIPQVKSRVLHGCKLVFSGLVPTYFKLKQSKAFQIAKSLGAEVQSDIDNETTHLVAVMPGTAKVNAGRRKANLKIVNPNWLWSCAERWEHVDERNFPLNSKGPKNRHPPPHCSSPEYTASYPDDQEPTGSGNAAANDRFMDTIHPLMSLSKDEIEDMDKEVKYILESESEESEEEKVVVDKEPNEEDQDTEDVNLQQMVQTNILDTYDKHDDEPDELPANSLKRAREDDEENEELPSRKFRRGEELDELDVEPKEDSSDSEDNDSDSFEAPDDEDDGEWNMMGAALEREFLSE